MANVYQTTSDTLLFNDADLDVGIVSDVLDEAPLMQVLAARSIPGYTYKYLKKTANPVVGFRAANDGRENTKATYSNITVTASILDASFAVDQAIAESDERGAMAHLGTQAMDHLRSAFALAETEILYGSATNGFSGLAEQTNLDDDDDAQVVTAAGTTATTASSVWLIRSGLSDCHAVWGQSGQVSIGDPVIQRLAGATTGFYPAYYTPINAWMGLQLGSTYSVVRICNITEDSGKGLTDDLISSALSKFPASKSPNFMVMSRRSQQQLQDSRTATSVTGAPAPFPTSAFNVPIVVTDQQSDTEALLTNA
jgi:hypothetical protein